MQVRKRKDLMGAYERNEFVALLTLLGLIITVAFLATSIILIFILNQII